MTQTQKIQQLLDDLWTAQDVCAHFGVTPMSVHLWRQRTNGIPCIIIPGTSRNAVRFVKDDVLEWAKTQSIKRQIKRVRRGNRS